MKTTFLRYAVLLPVLAIAACDGNDSGSPTAPPTTAPPAVSDDITGKRLLQRWYVCNNAKSMPCGAS